MINASIVLWGLACCLFKMQTDSLLFQVILKCLVLTGIVTLDVLYHDVLCVLKFLNKLYHDVSSFTFALRKKLQQ